MEHSQRAITDEVQLTVRSEPPETVAAEVMDGTLLTIFRTVLESETALPFTHQAQVFDVIRAGGEVALIAGTAAGKTLAVAVPLLHMAWETKQLGKMVFVYPTRALLTDQLRVLRKVAAALNQDDHAIGEVHGGMTSAALIEALSKRVIVATPDALYWFFRKNVKFAMALIYGLAQADAVVLDEAHLYTGLMQRNMQHFLNRLRQYRQRYLGKPLRVQYLTATANENLRVFSLQAVEVTGRSTCTSVEVKVRAVPRLQRQQGLQQMLAEALTAGGKRLLVVLNSARQAHQLFLSQGKPLTTMDKSAEVPSWFWENFGVVTVKDVRAQLMALDPQVMAQVERRIRQEVAIRPRDLQRVKVSLRAEYLAELAGRAVETDQRLVRRAVELYRRRHGEEVNRGKLQVLLSDMDAKGAAKRLNVAPERAQSVTEALAEVDERGAALIIALQQAIDEREQAGIAMAGSGQPVGGVLLTGNAQQAMEALLPSTLSVRLRTYLSRWMAARLTIDADTVDRWEEVDPALYQNRSLSLRRVLNWIEDETQREQAGRQLVEFAVEHTGVRVLQHLPGKPLVILYSGSMARYAREGLIELFTAMDRERPVILLSTSAVEVGVDFAADVLITEACELSSFLQRLGRIGRRADLQATAWVLVEPPGVTILRGKLDSTHTIERKDLTVLEAIDPAFRPKKHVEASRYADALQVLISRQLGRTGRTLDEGVAPEARALADQIVTAGIEIDYGLRGTMPAVSMADDGVTKDPFYILSYVKDDQVMPASSPFEVARVERSFNSITFTSPWRRIFVEREDSLRRCKAIAVPGPDGARIIWQTPEGTTLAEYYKKACAFYSTCSTHPAAARILMQRTFPLLADGGCAAPHLLLAYGPLVLWYKEQQDSDATRPVEDRYGARIELPEQWYLVLRYAQSAEEAWSYLEGAGLASFDNEILYDVDRPISAQDRGMILVDRQAGAVWEVWETLCSKEWPR